MTITEVILPLQADYPALPLYSQFSHLFTFPLLLSLSRLCCSLPLSVCLCYFGTYVRTTPLPPTLPSVALSITHPLCLSPLHLSCSLTPPTTLEQPSLSGVDEFPYLIFMGEIICVCVRRWWVTGEGGDGTGVCVLVRNGGWRVYRVYMKHHYHIKDMLGFLS